jgi:hypothetical protein
VRAFIREGGFDGVRTFMAYATVETCITLFVLDAGAMLALTRVPSAIATIHLQFFTALKHQSAVSFRFVSQRLSPGISRAASSQTELVSKGSRRHQEVGTVEGKRRRFTKRCERANSNEDAASNRVVDDMAAMMMRIRSVPGAFWRGHSLGPAQ